MSLSSQPRGLALGGFWWSQLLPLLAPGGPALLLAALEHPWKLEMPGPRAGRPEGWKHFFSHWSKAAFQPVILVLTWLTLRLATPSGKTPVHLLPKGGLQNPLVPLPPKKSHQKSPIIIQSFTDGFWCEVSLSHSSGRLGKDKWDGGKVKAVYFLMHWYVIVSMK